MIYECKLCGDTNKGRIKVSVSLEIILWIFLTPIGIIYSLWRRCYTRRICRNCRHDSLVPIKR